MPSTPLTCCSIGSATVSTSVFEFAPGQFAETCTVGGVIGGYCETGSTPSATPPRRIVTNAMTFARTGRSMKNLASKGGLRPPHPALSPRRGERRFERGGRGRSSCGCRRRRRRRRGCWLLPLDVSLQHHEERR